MRHVNQVARKSAATVYCARLASKIRVCAQVQVLVTCDRFWTLRSRFVAAKVPIASRVAKLTIRHVQEIQLRLGTDMQLSLDGDGKHKILNRPSGRNSMRDSNIKRLDCTSNWRSLKGCWIMRARNVWH